MGYYLAMALYVLICFLLLVVVLLQQGKGGDIAAAFGGASSQTAFGARAGATVLTRATAILATLFMLGALGLGALSKTGGSGSVVSGKEGPPPAATPAPPPLPVAPLTTPPPGTKTPDAGKTPDASKTDAGKTTTPPATPKRGGGGV
jgi:preprotein translocase subunit SecG